MDKYIDKCKSTIKEIIKNVEDKKIVNLGELDIEFAVVSYTDHGYFKSNLRLEYILKK